MAKHQPQHVEKLYGIRFVPTGWFWEAAAAGLRHSRAPGQRANTPVFEGKTEFPLFPDGKRALLWSQSIRTMTLDEAKSFIRTCANQMNSRYGRTVFDEWAVVSLAENKARVLVYYGPRNDDFLKNFVRDLGALRTELLGGRCGVGDFEFARYGAGTGFESFMVLGSGAYLICNNTAESMESITKNPRWLNAQVPFAELSDKVRDNPLTVSGDTQFFKKPL